MMYKALSLCFEGSSPGDIPPHPLSETSADIAEMAVHLTEYFQKQRIAYSQVMI